MTPIILFILGLCIEIVIQTVFLTAALWIMIKLQKLEYNFLGLAGAAALTNVLDKVLNLAIAPFLGSYLTNYVSTPIVVIVLAICIWKVTQADHVDVIFTVGVGYALLFCMNLFLLGALMGDLRPDLHPGASTAADTASTNSTAVAPSHPHAVVADPAAVQKAQAVAKNLSVKGLIRNGSKSELVLGLGTKNRVLGLGEEIVVQMAASSNHVRFDDLDTNSVTVSIDGTPVKLKVD